jgi:hypothetical protein
MKGSTVPGIDPPVTLPATDDLRTSGLMPVYGWQEKIRLRYILAMGAACALDPDQRKNGAAATA